MAQANPQHSPWQGSLWDLTRIVTAIRYARAFGRLTLRNGDRVGIVHMYFHGGQLVHIVGSSGDAVAALRDLASWIHASVRFERGVTSTATNLSEADVRSFDDLLKHFQRLGLTSAPVTPRVVEGDVVSITPPEELLTNQEWQQLIEGTRRVSLAVAHVIGPQEALKMLRDILDDCSTAYPAFSALQIAPSGYLQIPGGSQLDRMSRTELLEGFTILISTCQYFCVPLLGEVEAHKLVIQSLGDLCTTLISLGVFQVNNALLSSRRNPPTG